MGLQSLPVAFGVDTAKWICVASIDATQVGCLADIALQTLYSSSGLLVGSAWPSSPWRMWSTA